ncbi:hypothetical protein MA16_Dca017675 [Dendrobium catenatum]|uniref:Uncharacterized protein n=1 Tax=Dendrobium catenatum TaxID=906689 RepID=A0A2I0XA99_9ASPA|nr:hypothetical protein MA16_Dca017675 [Dendrobium catenatum]
MLYIILLRYEESQARAESGWNTRMRARAGDGSWQKLCILKLGVETPELAKFRDLDRDATILVRSLRISLCNICNKIPSEGSGLTVEQVFNSSTVVSGLDCSS